MTTRRSAIRRLGLSAAAATLPLIGVPAKAAPLKLRFANNAPATMHVNVRLKEAFDRIRKDSNGEVDIEMFPAGQLGSDPDMFSQVRSGAIDMYTQSGVVMSTAAPLAAISGVGYAFKSYEQVWPALDGEIGRLVRTALSGAGLYTFAKSLDNGFRQVTSSSKPIRTADDLRGFKIRVPQGPLYVSLFRALGSAPTSMSFGEVYTSLQTHLIDGQENPLAVIDIGRLYEVQKFLSYTNHIWDGVWFVANQASWNKLPEDVRRLIEVNVNASALTQRTDVARLNSSLESQLKSKGMEFVQPDLDSFRAALQKAKYYAEWKQRFGAEAWAALERTSGALG